MAHRDRITNGVSSTLLIDRATTDRTGRYELKLPLGTEVSVGSIRPLYHSDYRMVTASADLQNVDIKLQKEPVAKGKVVDQAGRPVRDASVYIPGAETGKFAPSSSTIAWVTSDAKGQFELPVPGTSPSVLLEARKDRPFDLNSSINNNDPKFALAVAQTIDRERLLTRGVMLVVQPPRKLTVTVKDSTGNPVTDAWVHILQGTEEDQPVYRGWRGPSFNMDGKGNGTYDNIVAGSAYDIHASSSSHKEVDMSLPAEGTPGWNGHIEIVMPNR